MVCQNEIVIRVLTNMNLSPVNQFSNWIFYRISVTLCRSDWISNGRTVANLYGNDTNGISSINNNINTLFANGADTTSLFLGLTFPNSIGKF